ncbi:MAG: tetratricopeptide repeat protein, partial [Bacteroidales bacterium]|nr:tetratricopeptide repeat protein [Bacteroidales bacterium]
MIRKLIGILAAGGLLPGVLTAQINTEKVMTIGKNALYFEDYVLSIQYFNQVIGVKPYLAEPYFYRGLAKMNLEDFQGAEADCTESIERNPFVVNSYQIRGLSRIRQQNYAGAIEDYEKALRMDPENVPVWHNLTLCRIHEKKYDLAKAGL